MLLVGLDEAGHGMRLLGYLYRKVLLKNIQSQSQGWATGKGRVRVEKQAVEVKEPNGGQ
jgi:hypothetical protein